MKRKGAEEQVKELLSNIDVDVDELTYLSCPAMENNDERTGRALIEDYLTDLGFLKDEANELVNTLYENKNLIKNAFLTRAIRDLLDEMPIR